MIFRPVMLPLAVLALSACNMAFSEKPLFAPDQRSSALVLENGLWVAVEVDCQVDFDTSKESWPECAKWAVVSGNKIVKPQSDAQDVFMIDGKPPIIQGDYSNKRKKVYAFIGFEPKAFSPPGRIVALEMWPIPCGTFEDGSAKVRPFPGFSDECYAESMNAVRLAASKPPPVRAHVIHWKWVRPDGP
jgi:hypothetical protein